MIDAGCCYEPHNIEAEIEEEDVYRQPMKKDLIRKKVCEDERRQSLLDYLGRLQCEPLAETNCDCCESCVDRNPAAEIRHSKKMICRSSALVKNGTTSDENSRFPPDSASHGLTSCQSRMNVVQDYGGSILRGKTRGTETQTSRFRGRSSFLAFSSTKGSRNWTRAQNGRKFPPLAKISNASSDRLSRYALPADSKCSCSNMGLNKRSRIYPQIQFRPENHCTRSNDYVITTASTSDEEYIDYQVPIEPSLSYHRRYETGSESRTLVPTSSHVTIRICSPDSRSSLNCDQCNDREHDSPRLSGSENSLNHLEERVRRGLRAMCSCELPAEDNLQKKVKNRCTKYRDKLSAGPKYFSSTECQTLSNDGNFLGPKKNKCFTPRPRRRPCCCKCSKKFVPNTDFVESSDEGSFQRFKDVLTEPKRRKGLRKTSRSHTEMRKSVARSERPVCKLVNKKIGVNGPRRVVKKRLSNLNNETMTIRNCLGPPIALSASRFKEFRDKCECIRKSIRHMMTEESISGCEPVPKETPVWKGQGLTLNDFCPELPPLDHWTQYKEGMRKVTNEYRALKSCVNMIESEAENPVPSCCCTEKSVTRTYPSGTEFTFKVKRVPDKEACPTSCRAPPEVSCDCLQPRKGEIVKNFCGQKLRDEKPRGKGRTVCFEKSKNKEQSCCGCPEEAEPQCNDSTNIEANCEAMKAREADLVKTLETFCEKMKSMKSEFEKPPSGFGSSKNVQGSVHASRPCPSCGRSGNKMEYNKMKAKKLLIFPPEGEDGPPLTLFKNSSNVNCRVKGDPEAGFRYNVTYVQRFVSSTWKPEKEKHRSCMDSG